MKIIKYRKGSKGLYKVELDDGRVLSLYEEVILKYELLLKREVYLEELEDRKYNKTQIKNIIFRCLGTIAAALVSAALVYFGLQ